MNKRNGKINYDQNKLSHFANRLSAVCDIINEKMTEDRYDIGEFKLEPVISQNKNHMNMGLRLINLETSEVVGENVQRNISDAAYNDDLARQRADLGYILKSISEHAHMVRATWSDEDKDGLFATPPESDIRYQISRKKELAMASQAVMNEQNRSTASNFAENQPRFIPKPVPDRLRTVCDIINERIENNENSRGKFMLTSGYMRSSDTLTLSMTLINLQNHEIIGECVCHDPVSDTYDKDLTQQRKDFKHTLDSIKSKIWMLDSPLPEETVQQLFTVPLDDDIDYLWAAESKQRKIQTNKTEMRMQQAKDELKTDDLNQPKQEQTYDKP